MNYLKYIEFSAENLQFFLWFYDYEKRFEQLDPMTKLLAPEWTATQIDVETMITQFKATNQVKNREVATILQGTIFDSKAKAFSSEPAVNPFATPAESLASDSVTNLKGTSNNTSWELNGDDLGTNSTRNYARTTASAFENAKLDWQPCMFSSFKTSPFVTMLTEFIVTIQPFRNEIARIIATYIAEGAPRELNISARERNAVLYALRSTTHPSALRAIVSSIERSLRQQAHPNFIRWAIFNGNPARVTFARSLGVGCIVSGFVVALVLTLSRVGHGWRAFAAILWFLGSATLFAAWKGMCVVSIIFPLCSTHLTTINRFSMECTIAKCGHGNFSSKMKRSQRTSFRKCLVTVSVVATASKMSRGFLNMTNAVYFTKSLITKSGFKSPLSVKSKIRYLSRHSSAGSLLRQFLPASSLRFPAAICSRPSLPQLDLNPQLPPLFSR